jgi:hypothetical protein
MKAVRNLCLFVLVAVSLSSWSSATLAAGLNLSWNECGSSGTLLKQFACNTNSGTDVLVGSCEVSEVIPQLNGQQSEIDVQFLAATVPSWWTFGAAPNCRTAAALEINFDFLANTQCANPWRWISPGFGAILYTPGFNGPNRARIQAIYVTDPFGYMDLYDENYLFKILLRHARTVGTGSCAGCEVGATLYFNSVLLTQPAGVGDFVIDTSLHRKYAIWQSNPTPARPTSWGAVKSLYR